MRIHVIFSPIQLEELYFANKTTVVIDVLRATSVIMTALNNGAKEVIPVNSIEFAMKVSGNAFGGSTLLGGERNTKMIEGFSIGNSPLEYTKEAVSGKSLILFTTNGSKAIVKAKFSETLLIASFLNLHTVVKSLVDLKKDVELICAGVNGMFCIEDTICAGKIISELLKKMPDVELSDSARVSVALNKSFGKKIQQMLSDTEHGKLLIKNGFESDIEYCAQVDVIKRVAKFSSGSIKLHNFENTNAEENN
ncbi:MAG: 2-phosphosulfolactate phosphatase [bacterium]